MRPKEEILADLGAEAAMANKARRIAAINPALRYELGITLTEEQQAHVDRGPGQLSPLTSALLTELTPHLEPGERG